MAEQSIAEREAFYDAEIAPVLMKLGEKCTERGMSLVAHVEWAPDEAGSTFCLAAGSSFAVRLVKLACDVRGNVDGLIFALMKHGVGGSLCLHILSKKEAAALNKDTARSNTAPVGDRQQSENVSDDKVARLREALRELIVAAQFYRNEEVPPDDLNEVLCRACAALYEDGPQAQVRAETSVPVTPDGWKLMPEEADDGMIEAGNEVLTDGAEWGRLVSPADVWDAMCAAAPTAPAAVGGGQKRGIYIASKTKHAYRWRFLRDKVGEPIISTWIDEAGAGESTCLDDLWRRCIAEATSCEVLIVYREPGEVLKGAWVEVGAALAAGVPVFAVGLEEYTIAKHHRLTHFPDMKAAIAASRKLQRERGSTAGQGGDTVDCALKGTGPAATLPMPPYSYQAEGGTSSVSTASDDVVEEIARALYQQAWPIGEFYEVRDEYTGLARAVLSSPPVLSLRSSLFDLVEAVEASVDPKETCAALWSRVDDSRSILSRFQPKAIASGDEGDV